jgi:hypothetical protein
MPLKVSLKASNPGYELPPTGCKRVARLPFKFTELYHAGNVELQVEEKKILAQNSRRDHIHLK